MSSEITDAAQVVHVLFEGTELFIRITGIGLKPLQQLTKLLYALMTREKLNGKTSMKDLLKRGGELHVFRFPQEQLKKVETMAKKYGILYSLVPDFNKDGMRELVFHSDSLSLMNAMIEKLKAGQVVDLEDYLKTASEKDIDRFYEEMKDRNAEERTGEKKTEERSSADMQKAQAAKAAEKTQGKMPDLSFMETGYLKLKDIEAIPLGERLNILNHYQSGAYDPITITRKLVIREEGEHMVVRLPREPDKFIHIPKADFWLPPEGKTALAFLKRKEEMKVVNSKGGELRSMKGTELFREYFDKVNENVWLAMERDREDRKADKEKSAGKERGTEKHTEKDNAKVPKMKGKADKAAENKEIKAIGENVKEIVKPVKGR
ncbi:MAG: PcfB family protein [Lachnospiraceae bacterium]|nr:PcfB family protein [Lachnospiraceae bacterium]